MNYELNWKEGLLKKRYMLEEARTIISLITQGCSTREISTQTGRTEASVDMIKNVWRAYHKTPRPQTYSYKAWYKRFALMENEKA